MFSKLSGSQNRKRQTKALKDAKASAKLLCKFLSKPISSTGMTTSQLMTGINKLNLNVSTVLVARH